jgi:hypothetical protein
MTYLQVRDGDVLFLDQPMFYNMTYEGYRRDEHVAAWSGKA